MIKIYFTENNGFTKESLIHSYAFRLPSRKWLMIIHQMKGFYFIKKLPKVMREEDVLFALLNYSVNSSPPKPNNFALQVKSRHLKHFLVGDYQKNKKQWEINGFGFLHSSKQKNFHLKGNIFQVIKSILIQDIYN